MSGDGMASFVSTLSTGLSAEAIWGAIAPIAPLIISLTLVAIARRVLNKNLNSGNKARAGRV